MTRYLKHYLTPVAALAAFWPVGQWYFNRLSQSPEELGGLFALLIAMLFLIKERERPDPGTSDDSLCFHTSFLVLSYAGLFHFVPPLIRGAIAVTAATRILSSVFLKRKFHVGLWLLFILSLPVIPTLQFYLGYILRVVVADIALPLIRLPGFAVIREGACFNFAGQLVSIDAPCSGIKMLWAGLLLAAGYSCFNRLNTFRMTCVASLAVIITILANSFRAASLFFTEAHILKTPGWLHEGTGVLIFLVAGICILSVADKIRRIPLCG